MNLNKEKTKVLSNRERNEAFLIRVWKSLPSRRVTKKTISTSSGLGPLQWYQSLVPGGVLERTLDCEIPNRLERGASASEDAGPRRGVDCEIPHRWERNECQRERWPQKEVDCEINNDWKEERVSTRTLDPEGRWIMRSQIGWRGERSIFL